MQCATMFPDLIISQETLFVWSGHYNPAARRSPHGSDQIFLLLIAFIFSEFVERSTLRVAKMVKFWLLKKDLRPSMQLKSAAAQSTTKYKTTVLHLRFFVILKSRVWGKKKYTLKTIFLNRGGMRYHVDRILGNFYPLPLCGHYY